MPVDVGVVHGDDRVGRGLLRGKPEKNVEWIVGVLLQRMEVSAWSAVLLLAAAAAGMQYVGARIEAAAEWN